MFKINQQTQTKYFYPHISLAYGNHQKNIKKALIKTLPPLKDSITVNKISIVQKKVYKIVLNINQLSKNNLEKSIYIFFNLKYTKLNNYLPKLVKAGCRVAICDQLENPKLTKKLSNRVIKGTRKQAKGKTVAEISKIRDEFLLNLQKMRKKYENKIRK